MAHGVNNPLSYNVQYHCSFRLRMGIVTRTFVGGSLSTGVISFFLEQLNLFLFAPKEKEKRRVVKS